MFEGILGNLDKEELGGMTYSDRGGAQFDSFKRVFDLEQTTFGGEGAAEGTLSGCGSV